MGAGSIRQRNIIMATIGTFKKSATGYTGAITTLSLQAKNVRIVPEESRTNDNAPSHRVFVGDRDRRCLDQALQRRSRLSRP